MIALHDRFTARKSIRDALFTLSQRLPIDDKNISDRLGRAYDIVTGYGYTVTVLSDDLQCSVHKESTSLLEDNSIRYTVNSESCTCPDYAKARGGLCKHRLAVMIIREMCTCKGETNDTL